MRSAEIKCGVAILVVALGVFTPGTGAAQDGTCASPIPIGQDLQLLGNTILQQDLIDSYSCCSSWSETGPEVIYTFTVPSGETYELVAAELSGFDVNVDLDIFILGGTLCVDGGCLVPYSCDDERAQAFDVPAGTYLIAVDGYEGAEGYYGVRLIHEETSNPEKRPSNPSPADGSLAVPLDAEGKLWLTFFVHDGGTAGSAIEYDLFMRAATVHASHHKASGWMPSEDWASHRVSLLPGTVYNWWVRASDPAQTWRLESPTWWFTTAGTTPLFADDFETGDTLAWTG